MINHTLIQETCTTIQNDLENILFSLTSTFPDDSNESEYSSSDSETEYSDDSDETEFSSSGSETDYSDDPDSMASYIHRLSKYYKYNT